MELSIASSNMTIIWAFNGTLYELFTGEVAMIVGGTVSEVEKLHGFGRLGLSAFPAISLPAEMWNVYVVWLVNK